MPAYLASLIRPSHPSVIPFRSHIYRDPCLLGASLLSPVNHRGMFHCVLPSCTSVAHTCISLITRIAVLQVCPIHPTPFPREPPSLITRIAVLQRTRSKFYTARWRDINEKTPATDPQEAWQAHRSVVHETGQWDHVEQRSTGLRRHLYK